MLTYIIEVSCCWLLFFVLYLLLFRHETFFSLNRWYLIGTLLLGLSIPWMDFSWLISPSSDTTAYYLQPVTITMQAMEASLEEIVVMPLAEESIWDWRVILGIAYIIGLTIVAARFFIGLH